MKLPFAGWEVENYAVFQGFVEVCRTNTIDDIKRFLNKNNPEAEKMLQYQLLNNSIIEKTIQTNKNKL